MARSSLEPGAIRHVPQLVAWPNVWPRASGSLSCFELARYPRLMLLTDQLPRARLFYFIFTYFIETMSKEEP